MKYLGNAFSLQMLQNWTTANVEVKTSTLSEAVSFGVYSVIGHQDLADILGVPMNRENLTLNEEDTLYVAQYIGDRLPEGVTTLPKDATIKFFKIKIKYG